MRHARLGLLAALAAATIAGCDSSDSSDDIPLGKTSDVYFTVSFEGTDDVTAKLSAEFYIPGAGGPTRATYFVLNIGDALSACVGAVCKPMTREGRFRRYVADLPYVPETAYTISLSRQNDVSAPNTFITLPVQFTLLAPAAGTRVTDGETITLQWSPPGINTRTSASGKAECEHPSGETTSRIISLLRAGDPDLGTAIFSMAQIMSPRPWPTPRDPNVERCDVELKVRMARAGVLDSAFRNGGISFGMERSVTIEYTPLR